MANEQPWLAKGPTFNSRYPEFNIPTVTTYPPIPTSRQRAPFSSTSPVPHQALKPSLDLVGTHRGAILVRDPPRDRLPASVAEPFRLDPPSVLTRFPGKSETFAPAFVNDSSLQFNQLPIPQDIAQATQSIQPTDSKMTKKRRSLQSIFIPSFLQGPLSPTTSGSSPTSPTTLYGSRMRSYSSVEPSSSYYGSARSKSQPSSSVTSPRDSPPPEFLIDDDPFANLSASPFEASRSATPMPTKPIEASLPPKPRSPLTPSSPETVKAAVVASSPRSSGIILPPLPRALSSGRMQLRPAHQKPAFKSRPSLPSLDTLARMNVVVPKKIRKGRVGAGLPFEPWNNLPSGDRTSRDSLSPHEESGPSSSQITPSSSQVTIPITPVSPSMPSFLEPSHPTPQLLSSPTSPTTPSFSQSPLFAAQTTSSPPQSLHPSSIRSSDSYVQAQTLMPSLPVAGLGDFVTDLDIDFLDLADDPSDDYHEYPHHQFSAAVQDAPTLLLFDDDNPSELPYTTDTDTSLDDFSVPSLSRSTSLELSSTSLSRSLSLTSTSSSGSDSHHRSFFAVEDLVVSSSESDTLNSPPDEHTLFSPLYSSVNMVADWRSRFDGEQFELDGVLNNSAVSPLYDGGFLDKQDVSAAPIQSSSPLSEPRFGEDSHRDEMADAGGWENGVGGSQRHYGLSRSGYGGSAERGAGGSRNVSGSSGGGRSGGHDDDGDRRDDRHRNERSYIATPSSSEPASSDEGEDSVDDYGDPSASPSGTRFPGASESAGNSDDDDVPLAQRIPTALTAQRTIRRQVREEREQRRKERAARVEARSRQTTLRPAGAGGPNTQVLMSSSQEAAMHASQPAQQRQRTQTLPGNNVNPFAPEDLTRKLQNVQIADVSSSRHHRTPSARSSKEIPEPPWSSTGRSHNEASFMQPLSLAPASPHHSHYETPVRSLRPSRSFHRPERRPTEDHRAVPLPHDAGMKLGRSATGARVRSRTNEDSQGSRSWHLRSSHNQQTEEPVPKVPRASEEYRRQAKPVTESRSARTSFEVERPLRQSTQRPPVPPLPTDASNIAKMPITQQRVFIGDMQRFNMVEIGSTTTAGGVIEMVEAQGSLAGWAGSGGWMVWEVAQDFGMERPVRSFELLSDVQASWNSAKMVNTFVIRLTPLATPLSRSALPSSSPTYAGYVEWEVKRGKWSKRWMQLREHSLWLSKRDNGRDEVHLCSLSNFDAYFITRPSKAPKPFTFAVKSTDNLSFFENTADYVHSFSCKEEEGNRWIEKILVARSYVLYQERNVLFSPKAAGGNAAGGSLSRSGTRKTSRSVQPLVAVSPPYNPTAHVHDVFEPGSLLSKQG